MAERYRLKRLSLMDYKSIEEVAPLFNMSVPALFSYAKSSKRLHAAELPDGSIMFHPDGVTSELRSRTLKLVRRELRV